MEKSVWLILYYCNLIDIYGTNMALKISYNSNNQQHKWL